MLTQGRQHPENRRKDGQIDRTPSGSQTMAWIQRRRVGTLGDPQSSKEKVSATQPEEGRTC
ncbi:MAG: hypothetical protein Q8Q33_01835 [Chlamydiota bacterium]|nr:hypothetical protein [Chlamydiota bacterium]